MLAELIRSAVARAAQELTKAAVAEEAPPRRSEPDQWLTYSAASELFKIPAGTLRQLVCRKKIPFYRLGPRTVRFRRPELVTWSKARALGQPVPSGDEAVRRRKV